MTHSEYIEHIAKWFEFYKGDSDFFKVLETYPKEFFVITELNLDPVIPVLEKMYCPIKYSKPRDPVCMLRSLLLMTVLKVPGITAWVSRIRAFAPFAVLAGFDPDDTPGIGTHYDFNNRIINSPYRKTSPQQIPRSRFNAGPHRRSLEDEKQAKKDNQDPHQSKAEKLKNELLEHAGNPRPDDFQKFLEDLLIHVGILPSVKDGLITGLEKLTVSGDGSILETAASPRGKPACGCRKEGIFKCDHPRDYTSHTAQWCYDAAHDIFKFGDRYYHLVVTQNGHDFPLLTIMPGGNESDYTLSLTACDRFLKAVRENAVNMDVTEFIGDGHHDSYAHYDYFSKKGIVPFIPLSENSKNAFPQLAGHPGGRFDKDGTPLCPAGIPMRHHLYNKRRQTHVFSCPAKRCTHRSGESVYVMHNDDCPLKQDCKPESSLGPFVYLKSENDPRLFPPVPRNSRKFKQVMNQRSASERCNAVIDSYKPDRTCRSADRGLIRLVLADIMIHAVIRYDEAVKKSSPGQVYEQLMDKIRKAGRKKTVRKN